MKNKHQKCVAKLNKKSKIILAFCSFALVVCICFGAGYGIWSALASRDNTDISAYYAQVLDLPVMKINTQNGQEIVSKEDYLTCLVSISNTDEEYMLENESAKIRGRGNTSWEMPKKPYKLKFDAKVDLFGNGKAKTWTLIANYADSSLMRNYLTYNIGKIFEDDGLYYTTSTQFVDLYINNEYQGVYLVCEQVQVGKNRVEIEDPFDSDAEQTLDTGYLIEMDYRATQEGMRDQEYFKLENHNFVIKSPDTEDENYSTMYLEYIKQYFKDCFVALKGMDYSAVTDLIDVDSFACSYIVNEIMKSCDIDYCSFFLYKPAGGKLFSGPLWDYDVSAGNTDTTEANDTNVLFATTNIFYGYLVQFDEFKALVAQKLSAHYDQIIELIDSSLDNTLNNYARSFDRNFVLWTKAFCTKYWYSNDTILSIKTWRGQVEYLRTWLKGSLNYIKSVYCKNE